MNNSAKRGIIFLLALFLILGVTATVFVHAAGDDPGGGGGTTMFTVTFNSNGGSVIAPQAIAAGDIVTKPANPTRTGYSFVGWYIDSVMTTEYRFDTVVTKSFTLYAKWMAPGSGGSSGGSGSRTIAELFPDRQLADAVANHLKVTTSYEPTAKELTSIDLIAIHLGPEYGDYFSFAGMEHLKGLATFQIHSTSWYYSDGAPKYTDVNISSFPRIPSLRSLYLYGEGIIGDVDGLAVLEDLEILTLRGKNISGDFSSLSSLRNLTFLDIADTMIDLDLSDLKDMSDLHILNLYGTGISGNLASLSDLRGLNLINSTADIEGDISSLKDLPFLFQLNLASCPKIVGDLSSLAELTTLWWLNLRGTGVSGNLSVLSNLKNLVELDLSQTKINGNLSSLSNLARLQKLYLSETNISGVLEDLTGIIGHKNLAHLDLSDTDISGNLRDLPDLDYMCDLWLVNTKISGDLADLGKKLSNERSSSWAHLLLNSTGVYGDTADLKTVRNKLYANGLSDLSISLPTIAFTGSPISVDVPVKIDGRVIKPVNISPVGHYNEDTGKITWQVPALSSGILSYSFSGEDDILGTYSGVINQPYYMGFSGNNGGGGSSSSSSASYTISFESNGGSDVTKQTVTAGARAVKPVDPTKDGYIFTGWFSDKELTKEYNFDMAVGGSFTLYAKWAETGSEPETGGWKNPFSDVKTGDWFYDHVRYVSDSGLMNGTGATLFSPNVRLTRGMLVTILYRMDGEKAIDKPAGFEDVKEGMYYTFAVAWGEANGIVNGYGDGIFKPEQTVSRQEMATVLLRYAKFIGKGAGSEADTALGFADSAKVGDWALEGVAFCANNGIVEGRPDKTFDPAAFATRAEFATMIHRFSELVK